jgi:hypothetical protein
MLLDVDVVSGLRGQTLARYCRIQWPMKRAGSNDKRVGEVPQFWNIRQILRRDIQRNHHQTNDHIGLIHRTKDQIFLIPQTKDQKDLNVLTAHTLDHEGKQETTPSSHRQTVVKRVMGMMRANLRLLQDHHLRPRKVLNVRDVFRDTEVLDLCHKQDADIKSYRHQNIQLFQTVTNEAARPKRAMRGLNGRICS